MRDKPQDKISPQKLELSSLFLLEMRKKRGDFSRKEESACAVPGFQPSAHMQTSFIQSRD